MKSLAIIMLVLALGTTGCGTVLNLVSYDEQGAGVFSQGKQTAPREVYGGVAIDGASGVEWLNQGDTLMGLYVWCVDMPLSAVGDTVTLPLTMSSHLANPLPSTENAANSVSSFGKNVSSKCSGLLSSLSWFDESEDSEFDDDPNFSKMMK